MGAHHSTLMFLEGTPIEPWEFLKAVGSKADPNVMLVIPMEIPSTCRQELTMVLAFDSRLKILVSALYVGSGACSQRDRQMSHCYCQYEPCQGTLDRGHRDPSFSSVYSLIVIHEEPMSSNFVGNLECSSHDEIQAQVVAFARSRMRSGFGLGHLLQLPRDPSKVILTEKNPRNLLFHECWVHVENSI